MKRPPLWLSLLMSACFMAGATVERFAPHLIEDLSAIILMLIGITGTVAMILILTRGKAGRE